MKTYGDNTASSGVTHYQIHDGGIDVRFKSGTIYRYTRESCGELAVRRMQQLAQKGSGLSGFIGSTAPAHESKRRGWRA